MEGAGGGFCVQLTVKLAAFLAVLANVAINVSTVCLYFRPGRVAGSNSAARCNALGVQLGVCVILRIRCATLPQFALCLLPLYAAVAVVVQHFSQFYKTIKSH